MADLPFHQLVRYTACGPSRGLFTLAPCHLSFSVSSVELKCLALITLAQLTTCGNYEISTHHA